MWYSYALVLSYNAMLNFIIGERGVGKSYGIKKHVIKRFIKKNRKFIYLRRYETELDKSLKDNEFFKDETTFTYTTYENKENYLADIKKVYSLFENYESTIMLSTLEKEMLSGILEITNPEDLSTLEWINYCVESRETPFLPMFLADTKTFSKTGNVYSSELDKIITMPMGSNVVLANIKYTTDITETQLKSSTMIMDMDMASSSSSSMTNYNYQKLDFSNKANFKVLSNLNGYEINDDLDANYFFNPNALFGE